MLAWLAGNGCQPGHEVDGRREIATGFVSMGQGGSSRGSCSFPHESARLHCLIDEPRDGSQASQLLISCEENRSKSGVYRMREWVVTR